MAATGQKGAAREPPGIRFTQYLMPDGRTIPQWITMPEAIEHRAHELRALGFAFEMEMLSDYRTVSFTIVHPGLDGDLACEICPNGPAVDQAVERLIMNFQPPEIIPGK